MTNEWSQLSEEELARVAQDGMQGQGATVEAMRRLRIAIEKSSAKSDTYSRRMLLLTIVLIVLTLVQVIAVVPIIKSWFTQLRVSPVVRSKEVRTENVVVRRS